MNAPLRKNKCREAIEFKSVKQQFPADVVFLKKRYLDVALAQLCGRVRYIPVDKSVTHNLLDPDDQARSVAACLARKYKERSYRLQEIVANIMRKRKLTIKECEQILGIVKQVKERLKLE